MEYRIADIVKDREYEDYLLIVDADWAEYTALLIYSTDSRQADTDNKYRKSYLEKFFVKVA